MLAALGSVVLASCGSGDHHGGSTPAPPPFTSVPLVRVSPPSTLAAGCNGAQTGTVFRDAEVEPSVAINPLSPANLIGAWQQDRWSNGGSQGLMLAATFDGGQNWTVSSVPYSVCTGGTAANGGDFDRATDPWVTISPNGAAYALSLSFSGGTLAPGSSSAMRVARSVDGGLTWSGPITLIRDGAQFFNDKGAITADRNDAHFVYAVWDRLDAVQNGPTWFARTIDGGTTWQPARNIFDPGAGNQTLGNQILSLPGGAIVNLFNEIDIVRGRATETIRAIRSADHGDTWGAPVTVAELLAVGALNPDTGVPVRDGSDVPALAVDSSGVIYVVWQDSRFTAGVRDAIALSRSLDGGVTWSTPVLVNFDRSTAAFTPAVHVTSSGVIGVTYYDFRNNTADPNTLPTDYWIATSTDAQTFRETHLSGPFDLDIAPDAGGAFLGDYQALTSSGGEFLPFFVQTNATLSNRTDVFVGFPGTLASAQMQSARSSEKTAEVATSVQMTPEWQQRIHERILRRLERRVPDRTR